MKFEKEKTRLPTESPLNSGSRKNIIWLNYSSFYSCWLLASLPLCSFGTFYSAKADTKPALNNLGSLLVELFRITDVVEGIYILNQVSTFRLETLDKNTWSRRETCESTSSCFWFLYNGVCKVTAKLIVKKKKLLETVLKGKHWPTWPDKVPKNKYKVRFKLKIFNTIATNCWVTFPMKISDSVAMLCNVFTISNNNLKK